MATQSRLPARASHRDHKAEMCQVPTRRGSRTSFVWLNAAAHKSARDHRTLEADSQTGVSWSWGRRMSSHALFRLPCRRGRFLRSSLGGSAARIRVGCSPAQTQRLLQGHDCPMPEGRGQDNAGEGKRPASPLEDKTGTS
ncbi:hypothetical protein SKAU_G00175480 [Synaphobranchus kaupii]|uniref:Uncharacterized protein n=1 Tax=Synaphobranchus kaupii TaxID=118154 RepID=A0A9Q1J0T1_SYNKA|nr:hypothetical protein SKAU_G00175480 [Synaphobranchus kaupii]